MAATDLSILLPALVAGLLISATHVPLGIVVLTRGIVFIDIAIAQIAGVGVMAADYFGATRDGLPMQAAALAAALLGAPLLTFTERRWPDSQEAIIGATFVLAAAAQVLLLAGNPHAGEYLTDLLAGQILWIDWTQLGIVGVVTTGLLAVWFGIGAERLGRLGFYLVFGIAVTVSVQVVGVYLVFATLILPALATRSITRLRLALAGAVSATGYALGLLASLLGDLPTGPVIVWTLALAAGAFAFAGSVRTRSAVR